MATKPLCSIPDCGKPGMTRGYCSAHYSRFIRHGDPLGGGPEKLPAGTLLAFIRDVALPYEGDDCLSWPFTGNNKGYGQVRYRGKRWVASNLVCTLAHGAPPFPGAEARHSCGNGHLGCVNPNHLLWGSRRENIDDREAHGRTAHGEAIGTKLTEDDVRTIRKLEGQKSRKAIGRMFSISNTMVRYIHTRRAWARVS